MKKKQPKDSLVDAYPAFSMPSKTLSNCDLAENVEIDTATTRQIFWVKMTK